MHLSQTAKKQSEILAAREKRHILFKEAIWLVIAFQLLLYLSETIMTTIKWRKKVKKKKKNFKLEVYLMLNHSSEVKATEKYIKVKMVREFVTKKPTQYKRRINFSRLKQNDATEEHETSR